jgi:hypothetical protein
MQRLQLYIQNDSGNYELVDLFGDETIELTSTIQDIRDIGKVFTDYSQTFSVPASERNNKIFRHYYNFYITDGAYDSRKKKQAKIFINYMPFRNGKVFLNSVKMKNNSPYAYEIIFYGQTVSLRDLIGDDELTDLDLSAYNHEYTETTVRTGFTTGLDLNSQTNSIIYPLITSKKRLFVNSDVDADIFFNSSGNLYHNEIVGTPNTPDGDTRRGLEFTDLKPAIRLMHIIEAIESQYNISFTRDFFTAELEDDAITPKSPAFYNLYLWLNNVKGEFDEQDGVKLFEHQAKTSEYSLNTTYTGFGAFLNQDIPEVTFENDIVEITKSTGTDEYKIAFRVLYSYQAEFDIIFTELDSDGNEINEFTTKIGNVEFGSFGLSFFIGYYTAFESSSDAGTRRFKAKVKTDKFNYITPILHVIKDSGGTPVLEAYDKPNFAMSFNIDLTGENSKYLIPEMKVIDFLTGLFKMFNLTAYYIDDEADVNYGKIYVDTLDNYYADAVNNKLGGLIELEKYVDITDHTVNSVLPFTDIEFKYKENTSLLMRQHEEAFGEVFGDAEFNVKRNFPDVDRGTKYEINIPFTHMKYERLVDEAELDNAADRTDSTLIQWGYSAGGEFNADPDADPPTGDYDSLNVKPLLFYGIREIDLPEASSANANRGRKINWISTSVPTGLTSYWRPSNSNETGNTTTPPSYSLNFDQEFDEWQGVNYGDDSNSLYSVFYRSYVESVFNPAKRKFNVTAYLPPNILINYRLNDQIKIQDKIFRINSITTNLMTGKSELELLNIFQDEIVE